MIRAPASPCRPILLAACGNIMAGDDGFGPRVLQCLAVPPQVEVVDLALQPAALLDHLPGRSALIMIDAVVHPGRRTHELLDLDCSDPRRLPLLLEAAPSSHAFGLAWQLALAHSLGLLPPLSRLIALAIPTPTLGAPLSAEARAMVPQGANRAAQWCQRYCGALAPAQHT